MLRTNPNNTQNTTNTTGTNNQPTHTREKVKIVGTDNNDNRTSVEKVKDKVTGEDRQYEQTHLTQKNQPMVVDNRTTMEKAKDKITGNDKNYQHKTQPVEPTRHEHYNEKNYPVKQGGVATEHREHDNYHHDNRGPVEKIKDKVMGNERKHGHEYDDGHHHMDKNTPRVEVGGKVMFEGLLNEHDKTIGLSDFKNKWVILYFYPKDEKNCCISEAKRFQELKSQFHKLNARIVGVSGDTTKSHLKFKKAHKLDFTLLSDPKQVLSKIFNADLPLNKTKRCTYLIAPDRTLLYCWREVHKNKTAKHADEVLLKLKELQKSHKSNKQNLI